MVDPQTRVGRGQRDGRRSLTVTNYTPARPKLLIVITLAEVGGAQTCVAQLLPALVREYDVTVATHGDGPLRSAIHESGARSVELAQLRRRIGLRDVAALVELVRLIRSLRPQIVHTHSSKAGILGRLAAAICRTPVVLFTAHGWAFKAEPGFKSRLYLHADRWVGRITSTVICVSETEKVHGLAARTCRADRTVVIRNGVDARGFRSEAPTNHHDPVLVTVGRLQAPKDFPTLIAALARLRDVSFRARIVGDGPDRQLVTAAIREAGLEDSVELLGGRDDVAALLADADCFVLSSRSEGLPLSVLEAMASGLPVVASDVGGVHELVDEATGTLVPPNDPDALAEALRHLLLDPALRRKLGSAGHARVLTDFTVERFQQAHLELYRAALVAARPGPTNAA